MNTTLVKKNTALAICLTDVALLAAACLVPAVSHIVGLSVGVLNPMLLLLLGSMLLVSDRRNAYLLALLMPLCSYLLVGVPSFAKMVCLCGELAAVVAFFALFSSKMHTLPAVLLAMVVAKGCYYGLKAVLVGGVLFATPLALQLPIMLLTAFVFAFCFRKINK